MQKSIEKSSTRALLMRKLLTICPVCKKMIFGKDINLDHVDKSRVSSWPVKYVHSHAHSTHPAHSITMFLDANLCVRNLEVSQ